MPGYEQPLFVKHLTQMTVLDGEYELRPGITIIPTPGHTHGSQSVLVDTPNGRYAITGDFCFLQENWTTGIMIGRYSSCQEWYGSYDNECSFSLHFCYSKIVQSCKKFFFLRYFSARVWLSSGAVVSRRW